MSPDTGNKVPSPSHGCRRNTPFLPHPAAGRATKSARVVLRSQPERRFSCSGPAPALGRRRWAARGLSSGPPTCSPTAIWSRSRPPSPSRRSATPKRLPRRPRASPPVRGATPAPSRTIPGSSMRSPPRGRWLATVGRRSVASARRSIWGRCWPMRGSAFRGRSTTRRPSRAMAAGCGSRVPAAADGELFPGHAPRAAAQRRPRCRGASGRSSAPGCRWPGCLSSRTGERVWSARVGS